MSLLLGYHMQSRFDIVAARHFARLLTEQSNEMSARTASLSEAVVSLRASWQDRKYDAFTRVCDDATHSLKVFAEHAETYARYLDRKANAYGDYLSH
jgi:hypothetical protein